MKWGNDCVDSSFRAWRTIPKLYSDQRIRPAKSHLSCKHQHHIYGKLQALLDHATLVNVLFGILPGQTSDFNDHIQFFFKDRTSEGRKAGFDQLTSNLQSKYKLAYTVEACACSRLSSKLNEQAPDLDHLPFHPRRQHLTLRRASRACTTPSNSSARSAYQVHTCHHQQVHGCAPCPFYPGSN